jgi:hypothetical protein
MHTASQEKRTSLKALLLGFDRSYVFFSDFDYKLMNSHSKDVLVGT